MTHAGPRWKERRMYALFVLNAPRPFLGEFCALDSPAPQKRRYLATLLPTCCCLHEYAVTCALMWLFWNR